MGKPDFCLCGNKEVDQLCSNCRYYYFSLTYIQNIKLLAFFYDGTGWFVLELVGNPEDRFSGVEAQNWFVINALLVIQHSVETAIAKSFKLFLLFI